MPSEITLRRVLVEQATSAYDLTGRLFARVADRDLSWSPGTGRDWMTMGQLLMHCSRFACGQAVQGFVTGDWGVAEEVGQPEAKAAADVPPVASLPAVESVAQAQALLAEDRRLTLRCLAEVDESALLSGVVRAPWGGPELSLFEQLQLMIAHLVQHKGQLFYYLKLMGKDVNTTDLWGA